MEITSETFFFFFLTTTTLPLKITVLMYPPAVLWFLHLWSLAPGPVHSWVKCCGPSRLFSDFCTPGVLPLTTRIPELYMLFVVFKKDMQIFYSQCFSFEGEGGGRGRNCMLHGCWVVKKKYIWKHCAQNICMSFFEHDSADVLWVPPFSTYRLSVTLRLAVCNVNMLLNPTAMYGSFPFPHPAPVASW